MLFHSFTMHSLQSSRPAWGAWIEIPPFKKKSKGIRCRAPHGARGLKYRGKHRIKTSSQSRPAWGAWIEIIPC